MRVALVGCGKMGEAILAGWLASAKAPADALGPESFVVVSPREEHRARLAEAYGVATAPTVASAFSGADGTDGGSTEADAAGEGAAGEGARSGRAPFDMCVLAVKPQVMPDVLAELADACGTEAPLVVTIAAGIPTARYEEALGGNARVVRVMPNMPLQVGRGATVVAGGRRASDADVALVDALFDALGTSHIVPEGQIDAVGAISGSGPAYVAYMVEALRDAGVDAGLDAQLAESLALETVGGTYAAMRQQEAGPEEMREAVCSPKGTTLAALAAMDEAGFKPLFAAGVQAAIRRSAELGGAA